MIGDGTAMYTIQSLWTMARENLNVCVMIFSNRSYNILCSQLADVGAANPGPRAIDMLTLDRPTLEFAALAKGMGVPGRAVTNADEFNKALAEAVAEPGPRHGCGSFHDERCGKPGADDGQGWGGRLLHQPRHLRDAFRRSARPRAGHALRARPVRRRGDGAADGYFRMKGTPASTLLHLGPGLANGLANLHNAKKANSGIVNIVGQHAVYHIDYNAPLTSDIEGLARPMSSWVRTSPDSKSVAADGAAAIAAAKSAPPQIATLILPADTAWNEADGVAEVPAEQQRASYSPQAVEQAAKILHGDGEGTLLLMTGSALSEKGLALAERIAAKTGCTVMGPTFRPKMARGRGRFSIDRIHYVIENALPMLAKFRHIVLVESDDPVAFFAYPNKPSMLKPEGCDVHRMTSWGENSVAALEALAGAVKASAKDVKPQASAELVKPTGALTSRLDRAGDRICDPRERDHGRRVAHHRPRLLPADRGRRAARLAAEHGRLDRLLDAAVDRRRDRLSGPQGDLHGRRRQRDVHDPVAVDAGARKSQHRHHRVRQPHLPDPARRVRQCRRRRARPARQRHAQARPADAWISWRWRRAWACPAAPSPMPTSSTRRWPKPSPSPGRG